MAGNRTLTLEQFTDVLRRSQLLTNEKITESLAAFQALKGPQEGMAFAKFLQEKGLITTWQGQHLLEGRFKGFSLGKYKLFNMLGAGGMGAVYLAEHVLMHRRVAVKVLYVGTVDKTTLERFYLESQAVAALDNVNIVRAHHFDSNDEFLYLVMEFVDGPDLQHLVEKHGRLPFWEAADYCRQAANGLAHAHEAGMVHRDIKPANLLRDPKGVVKLLDLGVARMTKGNNPGLTLAGQQNMLGTVDYLAPEQALDSHNVDPRADIYSLGCTLYYMLTGHPPFPEGTQAQRLLAHQIQHPTPILQERQDAPGELVRICERMMAKLPDDRPQSSTEVSHMLSTWTKQYRTSIGMPGPIRPDQLTAAPVPVMSDTQVAAKPNTTIHGRRTTNNNV